MCLRDKLRRLFDVDTAVGQSFSAVRLHQIRHMRYCWRLIEESSLSGLSVVVVVQDGEFYSRSE